MRQSTRLILNTGVTYVRMLVTVGMGLAFTRVLYRGLGVLDFGLWNGLVVSASVALMLTDGLSNAADRFLAFELGRGDHARFKQVSTVLAGLFVTVALLTVAIALPLGSAALAGLPIDPARAGAAWWAFAFTVCYVAVQMLWCPVRCLFNAHQHVLPLTLLEMLDAACRLVATLAAFLLPLDHLQAASLMILLGGVATLIVAGGWCLWRYPDARPRPSAWSWSVLRELARFSTWTIGSTISYRIRVTAPTTILLGAYGAAVNGAYALAAQLAGYQLSFAMTVSRISNPAMVGAEGRGDRASVVRLINLVNKYSMLLMLIYLVPMQFEVEPLLRLWVGEVAPEAPSFVRLAMLAMALNFVFVGYWMAAAAIDAFAVPVFISLGCDTGFALIAAAAAFWLGAPAVVVPAVGVGAMILFGAGVSIYVSRRIGHPLRAWWRECWWPVLLATAPAAGAAAIPHLLMSPSLLRMIVVGMVYAAALLPMIWFAAMGPEERGHLARLGAKGFAPIARFLPSPPAADGAP